MSRKRKPSAASAIIDQDRYGDVEPASSHSISHLPGQDKDAYYKQLYAKPPDFKALARLDPDFAGVYVPHMPQTRDSSQLTAMIS